MTVLSWVDLPQTRAMEQAQETLLVDPVSGHRDLRHEVLEVAAGVVREEPGCQLSCA